LEANEEGVRVHMNNESASTSGNQRHTIHYDILNQRPGDPQRKVEVHASPEEINRFAEEGYLIREKVFSGESLQRLRDALDRLEEREWQIKGPGEGLSTSRDFGGLFLRYLMDKDPVFLDLLKFQPFLSVARAMMGPQLQMGMSARISYPNMENQETRWHQHLRYIPKPLPPWFIQPHCMDVLLYLDDVNDANGPLCVVPGSHRRLQEEPPVDLFGDLPDQIVLRPSAGTAVLAHANLWHRAMPTTTQGTKRRLILIAYYPTWLKRSHYGIRPTDGLTASLRQNGDPETLELLGETGYM
jgi:ectoine hydroxylase-related dioxygenase (phytanoyl-CoA dioxygenase family)